MTRKTASVLLVVPLLAVAATTATAPATANASRSEVICLQTTVLTVQPPEICLPDPVPAA